MAGDPTRFHFPDSPIGRYLASRPEWQDPTRHLACADHLDAYASTVHPAEAIIHHETAALMRAQAHAVQAARNRPT